ncbi:hypothetical protein [Massilia sp. NR 4-1]|uniref:hypothetical protein n=1 Tax=Massilia sp. NR 4-1 TaxID=1678028 RepID=UPI001237446E|nr:hypothetical protein [Massilia sp. NR 4-1]
MTYPHFAAFPGLVAMEAPQIRQFPANANFLRREGKFFEIKGFIPHRRPCSQFCPQNLCRTAQLIHLDCTVAAA